MRGEIAIIGVGCTKFGEFFDKSYNDLVAEACIEAFQDAGIEARDIQGAWLGTAFPDVGVYKGRSGMDLAESIGIFNIPITMVSNYCATGAEAIRNASLALLSREIDIALAVGCEKLRDRQPTESVVKMMTDTGHPIYQKGFTAAGTFAIYALRHFHKFGLTEEDLAQVSVKNHLHAVENPKAHHRRPLDLTAVLKSPMVAYPLKLFDCCPVTDGASAVVLVRKEDVKKFKNRTPVYIKGLGFCVATGWDLPFFDSDFDFLSFPAVKKSAEIAYKQADIREPLKEIDVVEVHDCFTISELIAYEDLGFCKQGESAKFLKEGYPHFGGDLPVNLSGGLLSCGHPVGATGIRMVYEIVQQLRGKSGKHQLKDVKIGLCQNFGGPGAVASVTILSIY